jgi:hypothetical protein
MGLIYISVLTSKHPLKMDTRQLPSFS